MVDWRDERPAGPVVRLDHVGGAWFGNHIEGTTDYVVIAGGRDFKKPIGQRMDCFKSIDKRLILNRS